MDAVLQPKPGGQVGAVVEDQRDVARANDRSQRPDGRLDQRLIDVLQPQLQRTDVAGLQRAAQRASERGQVVDARRRDQIEAAIGGRHGRLMAAR